MELSRPWQILRDVVAVLVTGLFMFPIFWWALTSIKPISAIFDKDRVVFFDFVPTLINYGVTMLGMSRSQLAIDQGIGMGVGGAEAYDSRQLDHRLDRRLGRLHGGDHVIAVLAAYALSRMAFRGRATFLNWVLGPALHAAHRHPHSAGDDLQDGRACATPTISTWATSASC